MAAVQAAGGDVVSAERHLLGRRTLVGAPGFDLEDLRAFGFTDLELETIEQALGDASGFSEVFNVRVLGAGFVEDALGMRADQPDVDLLTHLVVAGASKRGWTTWTTGADGRPRSPPFWILRPSRPAWR